MQKMKVVIRLLCLIIILLPNSAAAQETPKFEVFGGYSYLRLKPDDALGNAVTNNNHGYHIGLLGNFNHHFGVAAEFTRHTGFSTVMASDFGGPVPPNTLPNYRVESAALLFGPRFTARSARTTLFGQVLLGGTRTHFIVNAPSFSTDGTKPGFVISLGGGLDLNLNRHLAFRVGQVEYLRVNYVSGYNGSQNNVQYSTGLVLRLGNK
ncbi:MAG: outer membrane beta-barrel protein [Blastocatellia bacterium]